MEAYSVLMPVYERERAAYFRESIRSMLEQSVPADDFVIVCDGPLTKELDEVIGEFVRDYPGLFQIVRLERNHGLGEALREGVQVCKNELIARMDSDDISVPDRCRLQLEAFETREVELVGGNISEFTDDISNIRSVRRVPQTNEEIRRFAKRRNPFNHPSMMFKKSAVLRAGNYEDCRGFEDYYLWARMLKCGMRGYNIQKTLVYMRTDAGMYERRGSFSYAALGIRARWRIYRIGYSGLTDFLVSGLGQLAMSMTPLRLRTYFYGRFLRK